MTVKVSELSASLGQRQILQNVGFEARAGHVTAIAGLNGSGKTTLLRAMSGDLPYSGSIQFNGQELSTLSAPSLADIRAVLAQSTQVAFGFTVIEVVRLGIRDATFAGSDDIAFAALADVGLSEHAHRVIQELSGGEQQRVHLARALAQVREPVGKDGVRWLFLDEPVSNLDIAHQVHVTRLARSFADAGGGVVAIMHDLNLTAMFADKLAMMMRGRVAATGAPEEVMTDRRLLEVYGCAIRVGFAPPSTPFVLPQSIGGL